MITRREEEMLTRYEAGQSHEAIAEAMGIKTESVRRTVQMYRVSGRNPEHEMIRRGSEMLLERIRRFHPEMISGGAA